MESVQQFFDFTMFQWRGNPITLSQVIIGPVALLLFWATYKWLDKLIVRQLRSRASSADVVHLIRRVFLILVIIVTAITLLEIMQVPLTAFAFVSGAVAIGIGFGAQNIINNFISGWILMWERPIRIGDMIELDDARGIVETINTRSTVIRRVDGVHLLVPNSQLLENTVVNWTLVDNLARTQVTVGVAYGSPVDKVRELLNGVCKVHPIILDQPAPLVLFADFGDNSLTFEIVFWINAGGERDLRVVRSDVRYEINRLFLENDIEIAFPQRDVHLDSRTPVEVRIVADGSSPESTERPSLTATEDVSQPLHATRSSRHA